MYSVEQREIGRDSERDRGEEAGVWQNILVKSNKVVDIEACGA